MNSLACVAGSFLGEIFICRSYLYTPARSNKENDAFSPHPSPQPPIVFWFDLSSAFMRFISYLTNQKIKNKKKKPTIYAGYEL